MYAYTIHPKPFATIISPNSLLNEKGKHVPEFVGFRSRYSTCTGVFWYLGDTQIGVANFLDHSIQSYHFDKENNLLTPTQYLKEGLNLHHPENLALSHNGKILGVACNGTGRVHLFKVKDGSITSKPFSSIGEKGDLKLHGMAFSPADKFMSYVTLDEPGVIQVYSVVNKNEKYTFHHTDTFSNPMQPLKPKSIAFSPDGEFVAIGYCVRIVRNQKNPGNGVIASYRFDKVSGTIDRYPVSVLDINDGILSVETIIFHPSGKFLITSDQMNDRITIHDFNQVTGEINKKWKCLQNPESELSFCHGIAFSHDGKVLAVTNYGDDRIALYRVHE